MSLNSDEFPYPRKHASASFLCIPAQSIYQEVEINCLHYSAWDKDIFHLGPVVQSIVSLTSSLRGQLVKCFTTL